MGGCGITTGMKKVLALATKARNGGGGGGGGSATGPPATKQVRGAAKNEVGLVDNYKITFPFMSRSFYWKSSWILEKDVSATLWEFIRAKVYSQLKS